MTQRNPPFGDDRAVSTVVGYVLAVSITTILLAGIVVSTTTFLRFQQENTADAELGVVGQQLASSVDDVDRLDLSGNPNVQATVDVPRRVAGQQYAISVDDSVGGSDSYELVLETDDGRNSKRIPVTMGNADELHVNSCTPDERIFAGNELVVETADCDSDGDTDLVIDNA